MAKKSMAELIYTAYLTGNEALFTSGGVTYTFTPEDLKTFIQLGLATTANLDARLSQAQRTAINALEVGVSDVDDVIAALQAV